MTTGGEYRRVSSEAEHAERSVQNDVHSAIGNSASYQTSKLETQKKHLLISSSLETDKDVKERDGDAPPTFLFVFYDEIKRNVLDKEKQPSFHAVS